MTTPTILLNNEQLLAVYNLTHTATAIHVTEDAIIQTANDAMLKIWGKDRTIIGKSLEDALPELKGQPFIDMFKKVWREGITVSGSDAPADLEVDGKIQTFYFDFEYRAIKDDHHKTICILHTAIDVTDRYLKKEAIEKAEEKEKALQREQSLNEELAAANEELLAINEELYLTQESLHSLNAELEDRVNKRVNDLVESEQRFRTMAEATDIYITVADHFGNAIYLNKPWVTLTGRTEHELLQLGWADLVHPNDRDILVETYLSAVENKEIFVSEFRVLSKEKEYHWFLAKGQPRFNPDESFAGFISSCIDITDRKHEEIERQNLNTLVEASSEFIGMASLDMKVEYLNPIALKKLGWETFKDRLIVDCVFPEDREYAWRILPELINNGSFRYEIRFWNEQTGIPFWIEWNTFSIKDPYTNQVIALATVSPDITERKIHQESLLQINLDLAASNEEYTAINEELAATNEELGQTHYDLVQYINKLSESEEKLRQAIETGKMGTWSINPVTLEITVSDFVKELVGLPLDQDTQIEHIMAAVHSDFQEVLKNSLSNALNNQVASDNEYIINNLITGDERWVKSTGRVFVDSNGNSTEYSGIFMDITDRKLDELRKNDFIGMVSHELKTPLTAINGFVQVLQRKAIIIENDYARMALEKTHTQIRKMTTMINGFLNVSRLESGKLLIDKRSFQIQELLNEVIDENFISQSSHHIVLVGNCEAEITADRDKIGNVFSNLLSNAQKYSNNGTKIEVSCVVHNAMIRVGISDEGIGIQNIDIDKLFDRYYRVQSNHTISGFGIGLYLSAEIIKRHHGNIWVESTFEKGSTFYFELPLNE